MASEIESRIPHRAPFLFVDRVLARGARPPRLVAEWTVPAQGDWFRGHFPAHPVLPGVLVSELAFQSAAVLLAERAAARDPARHEEGVLPVLVGIEGARFRRTVHPGETLRCEVELADELGGKHYLKARVSSQGRTVLRMRFTLALTGAEQRAAARAAEPSTAGEP